MLVEWTNACNLRCAICPLSRADTRPTGHMSIELWRQILDCCCREGHFVDWAHFFGDPLLWKHFFDGIRLWRESGLSCLGHISTNGHLLTDERIDCLAESGLDFVRICVDTLDPKIYQKLRGSGDHSKLLERTEAFLRRAPKVQCQIQLLRSSLNPDEDPRDMFRLFGRFKNLSVFVSDAQDIGGDAALSRCRRSPPDPRVCPKVNYEHCPITWDGRIGLCCLDYGLFNRLGDMSAGSISSVFYGAYAEDVRSRIRAGDYSLAPYCASCAMDQCGCESRTLHAADVFTSVRLVRRLMTRANRVKRFAMKFRGSHRNGSPER